MNPFFKRIFINLQYSTAIFFIAFNPTIRGETYYVCPNGQGEDGKSWQTAFTSIQNAVDFSVDGDMIIVTNGVYSSIVTYSKRIRIQSVNGASVTIIDGISPDGTVTNRCAKLSDGFTPIEQSTNTVLSGFTLRNGVALSSPVVVLVAPFDNMDDAITAVYENRSGGGVYGGTLEFCVITNNIAINGGGACKSRLINCFIIGNKANNGGGLYGGGYAENCLIIKNHAILGGGISNTFVINCTISKNTASISGAGIGSGIIKNTICWGNILDDGITLSNYIIETNPLFSYSCTTPLPYSKIEKNNITQDPLFMDSENDNFTLQTNSPCIDTGNFFSVYPHFLIDLNGHPRLQGKAVDMGAFEFTPIE